MKTVKKRGFAIDPDKAKAIQSMGGKASPTNFKNNRERAREIGRLGGLKKKQNA